jgi:circadian clock protein KaiC
VSVLAAGDQFPRIRTGNAQADEVLGGGFPSNSINIVMGQPGTGKTIFAEQLLFANANDGDRPLMFITTLSEPMSKAVSYVQRFGFYEEEKLGTQIQYHDIGEVLIADGPGALVPWLSAAIKESSPRILVIDSFRAIHDLSHSPKQMRRLVSELAGLLSAYDVTTFLLGEYTTADVDRYPEFAVGDAIVELARNPLGTRDERFFRVFKLRGSTYREGQHAFRITGDGIELYPRLVSPRIAESYEPSLKRTATGIPGLDAMLQGGLWHGSTTLVVGQTGAGKTTLALQFAFEGVRAGEPTLYVHLQENPAQLRRTIDGLRGQVGLALGDGLHLQYASPVELQIDSIIVGIFERIRAGDIRRVVIDAVGDLALAARDSQRLHDYLYALVQHFAANNVTSLLTMESGQGVTSNADFEQRFSNLCDNLILLRMGGNQRLERTLQVFKTRNSGHDPMARGFEIGPSGARIV